MFRGSIATVALVAPVFAYGAGAGTQDLELSDDGTGAGTQALELSKQATTRALATSPLETSRQATGDDLSLGYTGREFSEKLRRLSSDGSSPDGDIVTVTAADAAGLAETSEADSSAPAVLPETIIKGLRLLAGGMIIDLNGPVALLNLAGNKVKSQWCGHPGAKLGDAEITAQVREGTEVVFPVPSGTIRGNLRFRIVTDSNDGSGEGPGAKDSFTYRSDALVIGSEQDPDSQMRAAWVVTFEKVSGLWNITSAQVSEPEDDDQESEEDDQESDRAEQDQTWLEYLGSWVPWG